MNSPKYRSVLRSVFAALINSDLNTSELRALAEELRRGSMNDELAYMIDQTCNHFSYEKHREEVSEDIMEMESMIKGRGVSKAALINMLHSIDAFPNSVSANSTIRSILSAFTNYATPRQLKHFRDMLQSPNVSDPYLKGISETRK